MILKYHFCTHGMSHAKLLLDRVGGHNAAPNQASGAMDFLNCCAVPEGFRVDRRPEHVEVPCSDSWLQPQV